MDKPEENNYLTNILLFPFSLLMNVSKGGYIGLTQGLYFTKEIVSSSIDTALGRSTIKILKLPEEQEQRALHAFEQTQPPVQSILSSAVSALMYLPGFIGAGMIDGISHTLRFEPYKVMPKNSSENAMLVYPEHLPPSKNSNSTIHGESSKNSYYKQQVQGKKSHKGM